MHSAAKDFCESVKQRHGMHFRNRTVLDIGSLDINGNNRYLFDNCRYYGCDIARGPNVDIVSPAHLTGFGENSIDTAISTEAFEHDRHIDKTIEAVTRMLKPGGLFLFTCATDPRPPHGITDFHPADSPATNDY